MNVAQNAYERPNVSATSPEPEGLKRKPQRVKKQRRSPDDFQIRHERLRVQACTEAAHAFEYTCVTNERECGPIEALPTAALLGRALGSGFGDLVETMLEEIEIRSRILSNALDGDFWASDIKSELLILGRRAEVARELLRRAGGVGQEARTRLERFEAANASQPVADMDAAAEE